MSRKNGPQGKNLLLTVIPINFQYLFCNHTFTSIFFPAGSATGSLLTMPSHHFQICFNTSTGGALFLYAFSSPPYTSTEYINPIKEDTPPISALPARRVRRTILWTDHQLRLNAIKLVLYCYFVNYFSMIKYITCISQFFIV